jgi:hypothetical protein
LTNNNEIAIIGCIYKPKVSDHETIDKGTTHEVIFMNSQPNKIYQNEYSKWLQTKNLIENRKEWIPCGYYNQLNIAH